MSYQVSMMGWIWSGEDFCGLVSGFFLYHPVLVRYVGLQTRVNPTSGTKCEVYSSLKGYSI